ncbi:hypothetical protein ROR02_11640 [Pararhodospirillum oryzae]|uniref:NIF system FeS cluster assembly NifU C-terminal domain-containing protein n=1 Tax=Pararhodospirillum oryzae TaxID=478448 RepID=A0A512H6G1_9PROT|nr:hypothetical protein ROR02_11640 [Pararhodospirillum oryzae]
MENPRAFSQALEDSPAALALIEACLEECRPVLHQDGGDLTLTRVQGERIYVRLSGACVACAQAGHTLGFVRRRLMGALGRPVWVLPDEAPRV